MIKIGITGGIGSGKSTVCKLFESLEIPIYDSDSRAKYVTDNNVELRKKIIKLFGEDSYIDNKLNRKFISSQIFNGNGNISELNSLIHPLVKVDFDEWINNHNSHYIIKESAILFETDIYKTLDKIITVSSKESIRVERILKRDPQRSLEEIHNIIKSQISDEDKIIKSDFIIYNNGDELFPQILKIHEDILKL